MNSSRETGSVSLVGAGPGDPGLITVRGLQRLTECDALVYDNLMADEFIALSNAKEKHFVGKASGHHALPQEEINALLVRLGQEGKKVVRLKGGDPFVFGRGGEECQALHEAGIPFEVVPAVTAGVAGTAYAGIPATHREVSRGVTLVTGHFAKDRQVDLPWKALAGLDHTLVFYMAIAAMERITGELMKAGLAPETPAAVLQRATTGAQRELRATVAQISDVAREAGIKPPGLLVVGDVVRLSDEMEWIPHRPLAGKGVIFTRAAESQYGAVQKLRSMGAEVLDVPVVDAVAREGDPAVHRALSELDDIDAVAFTSALAVDIFFSAMKGQGMDVRRLAGHTLAAGSPTVVQALLACGVVPDLTKDGGGLAALLGQGLPAGSRVLLPRSSSADDTLPNSLKTLGLVPQSLSIYDSIPRNLSWLDIKLTNWRPDAVVLLSGSTIDALFDAAPQIAEYDPPPIWACVGAKTAQHLEKRGLKADLIPKRPDVDALVETVIDSLRKI